MNLKTKPDQAKVLTGKVLSVDAKMGGLTLKLTDKEINLIADSKSTKAALEKLKAGDAARVFEKGGKLIAASPLNAESKTKTTNRSLGYSCGAGRSTAGPRGKISSPELSLM